MRPEEEAEIKRQAADPKKNRYIEPVSGFFAGDAEERLEDLHEMFFRFTLYASREGLNEDLVADVSCGYYELRLFLQQIIKNDRAFNKLKEEASPRPLKQVS